MRQENKEESRIRTTVIMSMLPTAFIVGIVLFSWIKPTFEPYVDPLDVGLDKSKRIVAEAIVVDSTINGFRVVYVTNRDVTPARYDEIVSRPHIEDSLSSLKRDAPLFFGNMLYTDIYDFTAFAANYHPDPDVVLYNVFVFGSEKMNLYIGPNPSILNPATWINYQTLQGIMYIGQKEISHCTSDSVRVYRYWKCRAPFKQSDSDEHFSHFSEDERL